MLRASARTTTTMSRVLKSPASRFRAVTNAAKEKANQWATTDLARIPRGVSLSIDDAGLDQFDICCRIQGDDFRGSIGYRIGFNRVVWVYRIICRRWRTFCCYRALNQTAIDVFLREAQGCFGFNRLCWDQNVGFTWPFRCYLPRPGGGSSRVTLVSVTSPVLVAIKRVLDLGINLGRAPSACSAPVLSKAKLRSLIGVLLHVSLQAQEVHRYPTGWPSH